MQREEAKAIISKLVERFAEHRKDYHLSDYNEQKTRQDFINPFWKALGWDIDNEKGDSEAYREVIYEDKVVVKGKSKAPDYGFRLTGSGKKRLFYVEANYNGFADKKAKDNPFTPQGTLTTHEKKRILLNNIYGVDLDAIAVEVTKLSLLLKCMEGETEASIKQQVTMFNERVLPTLDNNIKDGNSLIDTDFYDSEIDLGYERAIKPFSWKKQFPEVFCIFILMMLRYCR